MQHQYSEMYLRELLPSPSYQTYRLIGAGVACCIGVAGTLWKSGPQEPQHIAGFLFYLLLSALVAILVVLIRRVFRKPEALRTTAFEIDRHGLWRQSRSTRKLMLGRAELASIEAVRSRLNEVLRIELQSRSKRLQVQGLENMERFLDDLRVNFPHVTINVHRQN
jgi:hypothetical protein